MSPIVRLPTHNVSQLDHVHLRRPLSLDGVAVVTVRPDSHSPSVALSRVIPDVFPTTEFHVLSPIAAAHAPMTDLPNLVRPPRYTALFNPSDNANATVSVVCLHDAVQCFVPLEAASLRLDAVSINGLKPRPLFMSARCGRWPGDGVSVTTTHLPSKEQIGIDTILSKYQLLLSDAASLPRNTIVMAPHTLVVFDNFRFAYSTRDVDSTVHLEHAAFSLPNSPELDAVLFRAADHAFYKDDAPEDILDFRSWRIVEKPHLVRKAIANFQNIGYGGSGLYFGPSGGSSTKSMIGNGRTGQEVLALNAMPPPFRGVLPAALHDVNEMRAIIRDLYIDVGLMRPDTVLANLMVSGIGGRSLEVVNQAYTDAHVTNFPIESRVSDPDLAKCIQYYGMTSLVGMATRLIQFGIYCKRHGLRFDSMRSIMYAGEAVHDDQFNPLRDMGPENRKVDIFASYGSSEVGEFTMTRANETRNVTYDDAMLVELIDDDGNPVPEGAVGRVVVTNLRRRNIPLVRFCQDDLARFIPGTSEFEVLGRHRSQIFRDLGSVRLLWADLADTVGKTLMAAFDGAVLFQLWSHDGDKKGDHATDLTLAAYAAGDSDAQLRKAEASALVALDKLIEGSSVTKRQMKWLDDGELVRAHSHKLRTFVSPAMLEGKLF